jgi:hypothetical protein
MAGMSAETHWWGGRIGGQSLEDVVLELIKITPTNLALDLPDSHSILDKIWALWTFFCGTGA